MNCTECKEKLVELLEGFLPESQRQIVEEHLKDCQICQAELAQLKELSERLTSDSKAWQQINLEDVVFNRIIREQNEKLKQADGINRQFRIWRRIMNSKITKYAAAAAIIVIAALSITLLDKSVAPAYALEQTIQASHSVQYLHVKSFMVSISDEPIECWVEFEPSGQIKNLRINKPAWMTPTDGESVIVWKDGKMKFWIKKKNFLFIQKDQEIAAQILSMVEQLDPKNAATNILKLQDDPNTRIEFEEPANKAEPIVITVTALKENALPFQRVILFVDQATKLLNSVETYQLKDGQYIHFTTVEF